MGWKSWLYVSFLGCVCVTSAFLTFTGAALPGPEENADFSFRNVENRRTHFMRYYSFGK